MKSVYKLDDFRASFFEEFLRGKAANYAAKRCLCMHDPARVVPHISLQNPDGFEGLPKLGYLSGNRQIDDLDILCGKLACKCADTFRGA